MRLRFTIRDLLWLTLVAAMGIGWWVDHTQPPKGRFRISENMPTNQVTVRDATTGDAVIIDESLFVAGGSGKVGTFHPTVPGPQK